MITNSQSGPSIRLFVAATTTALRFVVIVEEVEPAIVLSSVTSRTFWMVTNPSLFSSSLIPEEPPRVIPNGNDGAPLPALLVNSSARTLPPLEGKGPIFVPIPSTSVINSSPSATIKSAPSSTRRSLLCV